MKISKLKKTIVKKIGLIYYHTHDLSSMSSLSLASWFQGCPKGMDPPSRRRVFILSVLGLRMTSSAAHRMQIARFTLSRVEGEANASASMVKRTPTLFTEPALMAQTVASFRALVVHSRLGVILLPPLQTNGCCSGGCRASTASCCGAASP